MASLATRHSPLATPLHHRLALITGASRGIGQAVAVRFAQAGAHVILVARGKAGLEETDDAIRACGGSATLVELDLADPAAIEQLALQIAQRFGRLDILVGNAALLGELSPLPHQSAEEWNKVMTVNVNANFHLIRCFDALLKCSDAPRALFVTSGVTTRAAAYWGAYAASKAALEAMALLYAAENAKTALKVNLVDPGAVRTRMRARAFPGEDALQHPAPEAITDIFLTLAGPEWQETGGKFHAQT